MYAIKNNIHSSAESRSIVVNINSFNLKTKYFPTNNC